MEHIIQFSEAPPLSVCEAGLDRYVPGQSRDLGIQRCFLLCYVVSGYGTYILDGRCYPIRTGHLFAAPPAARVFCEAEREESLEYWRLGIAGSEAAAVLSKTGFFQGTPVLKIHFGRLFRQYAEAIHAARGDSLRSREEMLGYAYLLLAKISEETGTEEFLTRENSASRGARFIEQNYMNPITVREIAAAVGVSRSWLYRAFLETFGVSPAVYLRSRRLTCAAKLLTDTKMNISRVAGAVGYQDALYFSKAFSAHYGLSPSAYRARHDRQSLMEREET